MSDDDFLGTFRERWRDFTQLFWPQTPKERLEAELALLDEELRRRQERMLHRRQKIEELRDRIGGRERRLEVLAARVQDDSSGRAVEALERGRQVFERLRSRLGEREEGYERQRVRFDRLKRRRAEVWKQLLAGPPARDAEAEDAPDYPF
jgi:chromosome segregation ATPase